LDYRIDYKKSAAKDLKRIGKANAKRIMDKIDKDLVHDPDRFPALSGPFAGMRQYWVADYRVIFVIFDDSVLILRIQDRKDVYRQR
jgi:addiction module RelE/StbE family toxin